MKFYVKNWSMIAPGVNSQDQAKKWLKNPTTPKGDYTFEFPFLSPIQRRRLSKTAKLSLTAATHCCSLEELSQLPSVFVSRHGEVGSTMKLLQSISEETDFSPTQFIHSVHGTSAGQFSIFMKNTSPSITVSSGEEEVSGGIFEAMNSLHASANQEVLLVFFDMPPEHVMAEKCNSPQFGYAAAFHLTLKEEGIPLSLQHSKACWVPQEMPQSFEFASLCEGNIKELPLNLAGGWSICADL